MAIYDYMLKRCEFGVPSAAAQCSGYFGPCEETGCKVQQAFMYDEACSHFKGVCSKHSSGQGFQDALGAAAAGFGFSPELPEGEEGERRGAGREEQDLSPEPLGRGHTGRYSPKSVNEQVAMDEAMADPASGAVIRVRGSMSDRRWPGEEGWVKMEQTINGVKIHYVRNILTDEVDDFKFKD